MPKRHMNVKREVVSALAKHGRLTMSQLLRKTRVSPATLSPHLDTLIKWNRVETEVNDKTRPPTRYYKLAKEFRRRQKLWWEEWNDEMVKAHELLDNILELTFNEKQKLKHLLEKYIELEELERIEDSRNYEIEETENGFVLRKRKTGEIIAVVSAR